MKRKPYHFLGYRADFDQDIVDELETYEMEIHNQFFDEPIIFVPDFPIQIDEAPDDE